MVHINKMYETIPGQPDPTANEKFVELEGATIEPRILLRTLVEACNCKDSKEQ